MRHPTPTLTKTRIMAGVWEGVLTGPDSDPRLELVLGDRVLGDVSVAALPDQPGTWGLRAAIPAQALADGVQVFAIRAVGDSIALAHFPVITGEAATEDLRAEVALLRAELDVLKRVLRRHGFGAQG